MAMIFGAKNKMTETIGESQPDIDKEALIAAEEMKRAFLQDIERAKQSSKRALMIVAAALKAEPE